MCINVKDWADRVQRVTMAKKLAAVGGTVLSTSALADSQDHCPPDAAQLGRATWTFLHTMSVYYPQSPSPAQQADMHSLLTNIARFYPCEHCASHMRAQMQVDPPQVISRQSLANWLCRLHNEVNLRLGKPVFDCGRVFERWREGPRDGSCDHSDL